MKEAQISATPEWRTSAAFTTPIQSHSFSIAAEPTPTSFQHANFDLEKSLGEERWPSFSTHSEEGPAEQGGHTLGGRNGEEGVIQESCKSSSSYSTVSPQVQQSELKIDSLKHYLPAEDSSQEKVSDVSVPSKSWRPLAVSNPLSTSAISLPSPPGTVGRVTAWTAGLTLTLSLYSSMAFTLSSYNT